MEPGNSRDFLKKISPKPVRLSKKKKNNNKKKNFSQKNITSISASVWFLYGIAHSL